MALVLVSAPSVEPLTASECWQHLRVPLIGSPPAPVDAALIANMLTAARQTIDGKDGWLNRALVQQTWDLKIDRFPNHRNSESGYHGPGARTNRIDIPLPPLLSVTSITYLDTNGVWQTLSPTLYDVDTSSEPGQVTPSYQQVWPPTRDEMNAVVVRFVAGYDPGSPVDYRASIPWGIKFGLLQIMTDMYENRSSFQPMQSYKISGDAESTLTPYRIWEFA